MNGPGPDEPLPESLLEEGLRGLFGASEELPPHARPIHDGSVLESIDARGAPAPRILLRDVGGAGHETPVIGRASMLDTGDGIQVLGEIARGGMGVVLKGRDPDLGRDLALKVLRDDLGDDELTLRRFVEEAQICGQLQHPGIVPVYAVGLLGDGRPYFTMKLVRGQTFSELLVGRDSPADDRARCLAIFERICQAIAYTHARGVVHRDLKPGNVMIGAFGEMQIVDWGLAKVLPRGGLADELAEVSSIDAPVETLRDRPGSSTQVSRAGTVMGTPAYMPPEQAQGLVDALDERSDVFSLGAILCAILTGKPPYPGEAEAARRRAATADLADARERLSTCGADEELVDLCLHCLAPGKADRPRTAAVLAERVSAYLAFVQERARQAQIDAAEARVRGREEKKRILVSAVFGVLLVLGVAGGYAWFESQRRDRLAETEVAVSEALEEATRLSGRAESSDDPGAWREALAAAQAARRMVDLRAATPELAARVSLVAERIAREELTARTRAELEARNHALIEGLHEVRAPEDDLVYSTDWSGVAEQYRALFAAADLPLTELGVEEASARIARSGIAFELAAALDEWAAACRDAGERGLAERLTRIARASDADPTRDGLRALIAAAAHDELAVMAAEVELDQLPLPTLILFANGVGDAGLPWEAVRILEFTCRRFPDDFASLVQLARWLTIAPDPPGAEIAGLLRAALALRPESVEVHHELGQVYEHKLRLPGRALEMYRESARRRPQDGHLLFHVGSCLAALGRHEEAVTAYRESVRLEPDFVDARCNLALSLAALGERGEAFELLRDAVQREPDHHKAQLNLAAALTGRGETDAAILAYGEANRIDPDYLGGHNNLALVLAGRGDLKGAREEFLEVLRLDPEHAEARLNLGIVCMNLGRLEEAAEALHEAARLDPDSALAQLVLGRTLAGMGDREGAVACYRESIRLAPDSGRGYYELGTELIEQDVYGEAAGVLREAVRCAPEHAEAWCNLGLALIRVPGRGAEALEAIRRGAQLGSSRPGWAYPTDGWIAAAQEKADLQAALERFARDGALEDEQPEGVLVLARLARDLERHAVAADLYARVSSGGGAALDSGATILFEATRSAALAAEASMDSSAAASRRAQALSWSTELLARTDSFARLEELLAAPELARLREPAALARLPGVERRAWLEHWAALRARLAGSEGRE